MRTKKAFVIVLWLIFSMGFLNGCPHPVDDIIDGGLAVEDPLITDPLITDPVGDDPVVEDPVIISFEAAVLEVYELVGASLFSGSRYRNNRVTGPNEMYGVCYDYAVGFIYYWNEAKNYNEIFGRAYYANNTANGVIVYDVNIVLSGANGNNYENLIWKGMHHDVFRVSRLDLVFYKYQHFDGNMINAHGWPIINVGKDWYDVEPTWWDGTQKEYLPYKLTFN